MFNISVVTPSFNQGRFISKCLESVSAQRGNFRIEHIILDNCSTDETIKALAHYQTNHDDVDVRILIEPDGGQTAAINKGFGLASGDIVCWLNTDEWYEPGALSSIATFFHQHPEVDVVFGDCNFVDTSGHVVKRKREFFFSQYMLIYYGCYLPSCATFIRRKVLDSGLLLDPEFKVTMDFDWYVRIAKAGYSFSHMSLTLANFTWHENNISSSFVSRRLFERRLVQDRYSGVRGPVWFRTIVYEIMRGFWLSVRVLRRVVA